MKGYRKRGNKWYFNIYLGNGKTVERLGGETLEEAIKTKTEFEEELHADGMALKKNSATVMDVIMQWYESYEHEIRSGTRAEYTTVINKHISKEEWASWPVKRLSPKVLQEYINKKAETYAESTMKAHYTVLNRSLEYAVYPLQFIKESPMHYVRRYHKKKSVLDAISTEDKKVDTITLEEFRQIREAMPRAYRIVLDIGMYTGCRLGEACAVTWDDVDLIGKTISITKSLNYNSQLKFWELTPTKTSDRRRLSISDNLIKALKEQSIWQKECKLAKGERFVSPQYAVLRLGMEEHIQITYGEGKMPYRAICTHEGGDVVNSQSVKSQIKRLRDKGEIPDFHFHQLRHTHATLLLTNGTPPKEVQERLGHSKLATTMEIYAHTTAESRRSVANLFDQIMNG